MNRTKQENRISKLNIRISPRCLRKESDGICGGTDSILPQTLQEDIRILNQYKD